MTRPGLCQSCGAGERLVRLGAEGGPGVNVCAYCAEAIRGAVLSGADVGEPETVSVVRLVDDEDAAAERRRVGGGR